MSSCKTRWNNIRDNYRKSIRKSTSGQSGKRIAKHYKYSDQLSFLKKHFIDRETRTTIESQEDGEEKEDHEGQDEDMAENKNNIGDVSGVSKVSPNHESTFEVTTKSNIRKSSRKREARHRTASPKLMEYLINKNKRRTLAALQHPVDAFLAGVAPTLKTLNPYYLNLAKSEIFASVQKYEMKMLMEQHTYDGRSDPNFIYNLTEHSVHYSNTSSSVSTPLVSPTPSDQKHTIKMIQD